MRCVSCAAGPGSAHAGRWARVGAACQGAFSAAFAALHMVVTAVRSVVLPDGVAAPADWRLVRRVKVGETPAQRGGCFGAPLGHAWKGLKQREM